MTTKELLPHPKTRYGRQRTWRFCCCSSALGCAVGPPGTNRQVSHLKWNPCIALESQPTLLSLSLCNEVLKSLNSNNLIESTALLKQPHSPETGTRTIGSWTGTLSPKDIDGKTRSWAGSPRLISCKATA